MSQFTLVLGSDSQKDEETLMGVTRRQAKQFSLRQFAEFAETIRKTNDKEKREHFTLWLAIEPELSRKAAMLLVAMEPEIPE